MLELKNITKIYPAGGEPVQALKGVSLTFRDNEFVSILGPSGCGKTTMLNIIGGLDGYTEGDLVIDGVSTKKYRDRDWDAYRNNSIGFVFQSYNLIPHQTVLANVELALTLSGVPKRIRRKKAKEALERVGLGSQLRKKPAQLSGGQMQRVAIARAIVNDPDIILADEPTGALDTETSVQVMDILKEIAAERLVIMVTHNPELAERYSTRIVRMLDGEIIDDSNPIAAEERTRSAAEPAESPKPERTRKPSMKFGTSFSLSLKNLITKKGRTALTSFAGSIGIIGIALIYAVSQGTTNFIDSVQEETLSSYPLTIEAQSLDIGSLLTTFMGNAQSIGEHDEDAVYQKAMLYEFMNAMNTVETQTNDLESFRHWLESERTNEDGKLGASLAGVQYTYDMDLEVYTKNVDGVIMRSDAEAMTRDIMTRYLGRSMAQNGGSAGVGGGLSSFGGSGMAGMSFSLWRELLPGRNGEPISDVTMRQYDVIYGNWPEKFDEVVLFVDEKNEIDDMTLYALGLKPEEEISALVEAALNQTVIDYEQHRFTYEELCGLDFRVVLPADAYTRDETTGLFTDLRQTDAGLKYLYDNALTLHVVGIAKPSENAVSASGRGSIGYTSALTAYVIDKTAESAAVLAQEADPAVDIFTGLPFRDEDGALTESEKAEKFLDWLDGLTPDEKAETYIKMKSVPDPAAVEAYVAQVLGTMDRAAQENTLAAAMAAETGMDDATVRGYLASMSDEDLAGLLAGGIAEQYEQQMTAAVAAQMTALPAEQLLAALEAEKASFTEEDCARWYGEMLEFSDSTYERNMRAMDRVSQDVPSTVNLYAASFADKDLLEEAIADYNGTVGELEQIKYTDYVGIMMSSITTIIDAITYVLIAFVAVSLIVSSIMIGVITLISVQERTKEIGILRAIGASKKNVAQLFNAETVIIGFTSGVLGVGITYLLCIPINMILHHLTGLGNLSAHLPIPTAVILVLISVLLTLFSGIIPSRSAAKKDPVVALRTE